MKWKDKKRLVIKPTFSRDNQFEGWYIHSRAGDIVGTDIGKIINSSYFGVPTKTASFIHLSGNEKIKEVELDIICFEMPEVEVRVIGINERCLGWFWVTEERSRYGWVQRGLVVLESDTKGVMYAKKRYEMKSNVI